MNPKQMIQSVITVALLSSIQFTLGGCETNRVESGRVEAKIERLKKAKKASISSGTLRDGQLVNAALLPGPEGIGYYLARPNRGSNFGHDRLVFGLMAMGVYVQETLGADEHHRIRIHDLSSVNGGKLPRHINHQMGLDVDLALYSTDLDGNAADTKWLSYNEKGKSQKDDRLFDVKRNWILLAGILENKYFGEIRAILLADHLKEKLLAHARSLAKNMNPEQGNETKRLQELIERATSLVRQPKSSPHDNHFHLSLKPE